jgi:shikimate 5-dehydrogenase
MHYYFLGVTTAQSAMKRILPAWARLLDLDLQLIGVDMAIDSSPANYIDFALRLKDDKEAVGAVVTTHKLNLYRHAGHLFDELDEISVLTGEIGSIAKKDGKLIGYAAVDAMSFSLTLINMIQSQSWHAGQTDVVCFGAGGAGR